MVKKVSEFVIGFGKYTIECGAMPCPSTERVNLPKPFLVKVGLLFAMVVRMASTVHG